MPLITLSPLALIFSGFYVSEDEGYRRRKFNVLKVLKQWKVAKFLIFVFVINAIVPQFFDSIMYFRRDELKLSATFLSLLGIINYFVLGVSSMLYNNYFS
mmetsp:Transcript_20823/g.3367  ORF Transcript_20823/g.3367 Transcript_20823/m.3367 type:complete len:100 (-) Transcript_20823:460-759(-)